MPQTDPENLAMPLMTVDSAVFTYHENDLRLLLVQRSIEPEVGKWALPGGIVHIEQDESLEATALRKLAEKTGVEPPYLEQLQTIGNRDRDPRGWSVTVCYTALIAYQDCDQNTVNTSDVDWVSVSRLSDLDLAFDHAEIISSARERLRQKALYSIAAGYALPKVFTLTELQRLHELLIGRRIQKRSFRRRITQADLLVDTGEKRYEGGRPASLYRLKEEARDFTFIRNLES